MTVGLKKSVVILSRYLVAVVFCLNPVTSIIVLGWLTRRMFVKISSEESDHYVAGEAGLLLSSSNQQATLLKRFSAETVANILSGVKALAAVLAYTLPFSTLWFLSWFAGWENSFSKGYEQSSFWPLVGFGAVIISVPFLVFFPMAVTHQAATNQFKSIFEFKRIAAIYFGAPWRQFGVLLLIVIGFAALFGVRSLPTFAENFSERVASGKPASIQQYIREFRFLSTAVLLLGLLVLRSVMSSTYLHASQGIKAGRPTKKISATLCFVLSLPIWLTIVFSVFLSQFLNYNWHNWLNQPVLMLPWLG